MLPKFKFLSLLLVFAFAFASCSKENLEVAPESSPTPQFSGPCSPFGGADMLMAEWAPYIDNRLDGEVEAPSASMVCTNTGQTQVKTMTLGWPSCTDYSGTAAGDEVCDLMQWASTNRPIATGTVPLGLQKWYITDYEYFYDSEDPISEHCSDPHPLTLKVTYTKFNCLWVVENNLPANFKVHRLTVLPGIVTDPEATDEGPMALEIKDLSDGDDEADGGDDSDMGIYIRDPSGTVILNVMGTNDLDPKIYTFDFHLPDHDANALTYKLEMVPIAP